MLISRARTIQENLPLHLDLFGVILGYDGCLLRDVQDVFVFLSHLLESSCTKANLATTANMKHCSRCNWIFLCNYSQVLDPPRLHFVSFWWNTNKSVYGFTLDGEPNVRNLTSQWQDLIRKLDHRFVLCLSECLFPSLSWIFRAPKIIFPLEKDCKLQDLHLLLKNLDISDDMLLEKFSCVATLMGGRSFQLIDKNVQDVFWRGFHAERESWRKGVFLFMDQEISHSSCWAHQKEHNMRNREEPTSWKEVKPPGMKALMLTVDEDSVLLCLRNISNHAILYHRENNGGTVPYDFVTSTQMKYMLPWIFGFDTYGGARDETTFQNVAKMLCVSLSDSV